MANSTTFNIILKGIADFKDVANNIDVIQKNLNQLKLPADLKSKFTGIFSELEKESAKYQKYLDSGFKVKGDVTGLEKTGNRIKFLFESLASTMQKINPNILKDSFVIDTKQFDDLTQKIQRAKQEMSDLANQGETAKAFQNIQTALEKIGNMSKSKSISAFSEAFKAGNIEEAQAALAKLYQNANKFGDGKQTEFKSYLDLLSGALQTLAGNTALQDKQKELQGFISQLSTLEKTQIENFFKNFESFRGSVSGQASEWNKYRAGVEGAASSVFDLNTQMDQLKHRIGYFFGITNIFNLFKRTVREAINTVKELDAVMTETAVVTDFDIGDMWNKLPQYAAQANALGASIKDLYAATTLYYQQGLQTDAAMSVGVETMKMARIAGMEAADATTAMTAALRGFNMEVNEMNAQRVNDVYSELAAITAADTNQIATAMGKTASIANSANMEFETTAALLAQIIETTQEAPETAGTAMKTIIARFTEVKKLFSEGQLTGEDEEGEAISINKIDDALKSVGISLKDFLNGSKGIDEIFLELASKWDTLDLATQRYIATTAAGSRQQSRFIAMMSNYDRTMELVTAANDSAGASQEQFDKTLESMEAKLQRLKNAWDQFVMGLANNDLLKFGVDALAGLLNAINGLTSALSGGGGAKSLLSLLAVVGALKGGQALARGFFEPGSAGISLGYGKGFQMSLGKKSAVDQVVGANSQQRAQALGRRDGSAYFAGFQRAAQAKGAGGSGFGAFFGTKTARINMANLTKQIGIENRNGIDQLKAGKINQQQWKEQLKKNNQRLIEAKNHNASMGAGVTSMYTPDFSAISMGATAAGLAITGLGKCFEKAGPQGQAFGRALEKAGAIMTSVGSIGMMLGPMLNNLGISFSNVGIHIAKAAETAETVGDVAKGASEAAEALDDVGDAAKGAGAGLAGAGAAGAKGGTAVAASWGSVGAVLGWVALAALALGAIIFAAYKMHPETQLKEAKQAAENAEKGAQNATAAFEELTNAIDGLDGKREKIDELTRGTKEWKQEVTALNDEVLKLVEQNPELASFVKNNNGILEFDKSGNTTDSFDRTYEDVMVMKESQVNAAKAASYDAQRTVLKKQEAVKYLDYVNDKAGQGINASRMSDMNIHGDFSALTNSLARAISNGELQDIKYDDNDSAYEHNQEIFAKYIRDNFDYSIAEAGVLADELMKEASALQQFGNSLAQVDAQMDLYNDQLASTIVESAEVAEGTEQAQILENLDSSILTGIYDSVYDQAKADALGDKTRKERRQAYADLMGYEWAGGNKYNTENGQITVRAAEMRAALASQEATSQAGEKAAELAKDIASKNTSQQELIGALFNSDGSGMTRKVLSEWGAYNSTTGQYELDLSKAATQQGMSKEDWANSIKDSQGNPAIWAEEYINSFAESITEEEAMKKMQQAEVANQIAIESGYTDIQSMAEAFGTSVDGAVEMIVNSLETGGDAFIDARKNVVKKMAKHTGKNQDQYLDLATQLQVYEKVFGEEIVQTMSNIFSSLEMSNNDELAAQGFSAFQKILDTGDRAAVEEVSGFIQDVNWGSSIEALDAINNEIERGTEATKQYAANLKAMDASYFDLGSLTQDLVGSEQYSEISNELDKILATSEELSATDVKDLAKSYSTLNKYLENTEVTASGLAKALTLLQNGEIAVNQLTNAVMSALSSMNSLDDLVADTVESLENFDYGVDENTVTEKTKEMAEILRANIDKGAYGNSQNFQILDYMFDPGWDDGKTGEALEAEMERLTKILEDNSENFENAWKGLAEQGDVGSWLDITYKDGEAFLEGFEGHTTDEIVSEMARAYGLTENMARMMLTDFKNYSSDLAAELAVNDFTAGIAAMEDSLRIGHDGSTKFIDESEIQALVAATGKSRQDILDALQAEADEDGFIITPTNFYDKNGILKTGEELFDELDKISGWAGEDSWQRKYSTRVFEGYTNSDGEFVKKLAGGIFDFASMEKDMKSYGFDDSEIAKTGNEMLSDLWSDGATEATITLKGDNGELLEVIAEAGDTYEDVIAKADYTQTSNQLTDSIVAAFEQIESLNIDVNEEGLASLQEVLDKLQTGITVDDNGTISGVAQEMQDFIDEYDQKTITLNATVNPTSFTASATAGGSGTVTINLGAAAAEGLINAPHNMPVLTGEEGPELVQTNGGYYITGQNGPEMANIKKGDTVYTAEETKRILKGSNHKLAPRYASGYGKTGTSGSGGSGSDKDGWETSIDKLYNLLRDIDEELRQRENLERRYNALLEKIGTNTNDLVKVTRQTLSQLDKERGLQEQLIAGRNSQIDDYLKEQSKYNKYAWVEEDEWGERVLRIDWEKINAITSEEEGKEVEKYLGQLEAWMEDIGEAQDTIADIDDTVREIYERGKDEYFDLESQIRDALEGERQKEIDKLSEINDTINDTNTRLLDSIQESIDEQRQERDNAKTEEELADKQRRLSYLQMDTSGANALEILELQKELEEGQRDYTDNLIDQKITALQKQNDEAAQQRQDQIDIMQAQLDHYIKSGEVWEDAYKLMQKGINDQGIVVGSSLWKLLASNEDYASMSNLEKLKWAEELNDNVAQAMLWLRSGNSTEGLISSGELKKGGKVTFTTSDGTTVTGTLKDNGDVVDDKTGQTYKNVYKNWDGSFKTDEGYNSEKYVAPELEPTPAPAPAPVQDPNEGKTQYRTTVNNGKVYYQSRTYKNGKWGAWSTYKTETTPQFKYETAGNKTITFKRDFANGSWSNWQKIRVDAGIIARYATGGLATETGPAWLDGTKSRPEYVLNADQTRAFFTLVDVLEGFGRGNISNSQNSGDNTYDIDINVESIGSDYDVEQLASTVKRLINDDARYRNNNTIGYSR